jgi:nicotinamidase-related amidase
MFFRHPLTLLADAVPPIPIEPATTRLLLQDLHAPFADPARVWLAARADAKVLRREFDDYFGALETAALAIERCLAACRARRIPVRFVCLGYRPPDEPSAFQRATGWLWSLDGPDGAFPSQWQPLPGETVHAKPGWGALGSPTLAAELRADAIRSVILCGTMLEYGIRQTSLELADAGVRVLIVGDATVALTSAGRSALSGGLSHGLIKVRAAGELAGLFAEHASGEAVIV